MAARSTIGILNKDGSVNYICCVYRDNDSEILSTHYNTEAKIRRLLKLGDLFLLEKKLNPSKGTKHSYSTPEKDVCIASCRDRYRDEDPTYDLLPSIDVYKNLYPNFECMYLWSEDKGWQILVVNVTFESLFEEE